MAAGSERDENAGGQRADLGEFVIIGGGPVGLWTAIQLKKRRPASTVTVYERHHQYQRHHVLRLEYGSLLFFSKATLDLPEEAFLRDVTGHGFRTLVLQPAGSTFLRTSDLERALLDYASTLGIKLKYTPVAGPAEVAQLHPACRTFIAADGAHSGMRTALMGSDATEQIALQYVVEVKYQAEGRAGTLGIAAEQLRTNRQQTHLAFEYVGRERGGTTPVTLRFFVDRETYEALPQSSFKAPLPLDSLRAAQFNPDTPMARLMQDVAAYMGARGAHAGETYQPGSGRVTKLTLSLYAANRFAVLDHDPSGGGTRAWYLVGDAAMGVPFFRSLNAGFVLSSRLAIVLTSSLSPAIKVKGYNRFRPVHVSWEFTAARGKNLALRAYDMLRRTDAGGLWKASKETG